MLWELLKAILMVIGGVAVIIVLYVAYIVNDYIRHGTPGRH